MGFSGEELKKFNGWEIMDARDICKGVCEYKENSTDRVISSTLKITWYDGTHSNIYAVSDDATRKFTGFWGEFDAKIIGERMLQICS